ncbi:MAG: hypothetical protein ACO395_05135 [Pontimonas sp.]
MSDQQTAVAEPPTDWLESEIAKTVVLPRLQKIVRNEEITSKSHLYQCWVAQHGQVGRARFDTWLDMLEVRFSRQVTITFGNSGGTVSSSDSAIFDNETEDDLA